MEVQFYYNISDDRKINKELTEGDTFEGQARSEINIMSPVILFDTNVILEYFSILVIFKQALL